VIAILLCILAFGVCYWAGRRSLAQGLIAVLTFGFFYGILRANLLTTFSHFIFDAGLLGLYAARLGRRVEPGEAKRSHVVAVWVALLILWPTLLVMLPFQPWLVSLVGLRGNIFFIPLVLLGSRLKGKDLITLGVGLAALDLVALAFAGAEYVLGVPRFFPVSPVTRIIYASGDVEGGFFRIPSIFSSAHSFGGTMVATMPYLVGLWTNGVTRFQRSIALITIPGALLGVLMSATRQNFIFGFAMVVFFVFTAKIKGKQRVTFFVILGLLASVALNNTRFQRFKSLKDTDAVGERIAGSVNRGFLEILTEYPMGNGLGGGGTSIPYFLEGQVRNPIGMENEYARILSEQGVIGLLLWLGFVVWFFSRIRIAFSKGKWANTRRVVWCLAAVSCGTAWIGTGLLTSIPGTLLLMLGMGLTVVPEAAELPVSSPIRGRSNRPERRSLVPVFPR
jgi:hypothetical protein